MNGLTAAVWSSAVLFGLVSPLACAGGKAATVDGDAARQAYELRMDGKVDEARQLLEQKLSTSKNDAQAWFELARLEFYRAGQTQDMDEAQKAIEQAIALDGDNARYQCFAGYIATYNFILKAHARKMDEMPGQMEKAATALERAVEINPECHEARLLLVSCYGNNTPEMGGDRDKAEQQVMSLEQRSPVDGALARCEFSVSDSAARLKLWSELAQKLEDDARVHENLALQYARSGDADRAKIEVDRALELDPSCGQALLDIGLSFAFEQKLEPAEQFIQRYLDQQPAPPRGLQAYAYMVLGRVQKMSGDEEAAKATLEQARQLDSYCWFTMRPPPEILFDAP